MQKLKRWSVEGTYGDTPSSVRAKLEQRATAAWETCVLAIKCAGGLESTKRLGVYRRDNLKEYVEAEELLHRCTGLMKIELTFTFDGAYHNTEEVFTLDEAISRVKAKIDLLSDAISSTTELYSALLMHTETLQYWAKCGAELRILKQEEASANQVLVRPAQ